MERAKSILVSCFGSLRRRAILRIAKTGSPDASLINDERSLNVLIEAVKSNFIEVRVAAAAGSRNLGSNAAASKILDLLKNDPDQVVRRKALRSMAEKSSEDRIE